MERQTLVRYDGYTNLSFCSDCTRHQMSKVQGDELWVILLAPVLQCHHIGGKSMWFGACGYVYVCLSLLKNGEPFVCASY